MLWGVVKMQTLQCSAHPALFLQRAKRIRPVCPSSRDGHSAFVRFGSAGPQLRMVWGNTTMRYHERTVDFVMKPVNNRACAQVQDA